MPYANFDEAQMRAIGESIAATDAYLFGRKTYQIMAAHWPHQPDTDMFAATLNGRPKYVVSTTLSEPLPWQNSALISTNVPEEISRLKQQPGGDISVLGSGELVQTLIRYDLVDEFSLMVNPLVLGSGKRLFHDGLTPRRFELAHSMTTGAGVVMLTYRPIRDGQAAARDEALSAVSGSA
jgi:dihydrofolate reductase